MKFASAAFGGLLLSSNVLAGALSPIHPRQFDLQTRHRRNDLEVREPQSANPTPTSTQLQDWNAQAEAACTSQLATLNGVASNPAGMAVCYNVPFVDNKTGVFEAELRMYTISAPTGDWVGVTTSNMMVSLSYLGATVQMTNGAPFGVNKREIQISGAELARRVELSERQTTSTTTAPQEVKVLTYVGQLNGNVRGPQMNLTQIQALLVPEIELSATNPVSKQNVQTLLSSKDASFVAGIFADVSTAPTTPEAAASASAAANSVTPFIIPGVSFGIKPIGLVVTMVWVGLFVGFVGLGTIGRMQFREQYQRSMKREMTSTVKTI